MLLSKRILSLLLISFVFVYLVMYLHFDIQLLVCLTQFEQTIMKAVRDNFVDADTSNINLGISDEQDCYSMKNEKSYNYNINECWLQTLAYNNVNSTSSNMEGSTSSNDDFNPKLVDLTSPFTNAGLTKLKNAKLMDQKFDRVREIMFFREVMLNLTLSEYDVHNSLTNIVNISTLRLLKANWLVRK